MKEKINSITKTYYNGYVYNLELEPNHEMYDDQFYVCADTNIVIHNCHPRDNIALRYLAEKLNLGYDLFDAIIHSREVQAKNIADYLKSFNMPIVLYGITYKSFVPYTDGSYSLLIKSFLDDSIKIIDTNLNIYDEITEPSVIFISYHNEYLTTANFPKGSIIVDPWRKMKSDKYQVIHYGNTRK